MSQAAEKSLPVTGSHGTSLEKEFADFAYVVSHDLGAPLRHIREFSRLLMQKLASAVGEEEQEYMRYIERSIQKTETMIEGLLHYSRLNTRTEALARVECDPLFDEAMERLKAVLAARNASITAARPLPTVTGDRSQILLLLTHVLDNATKFHPPGAHPEAHISAEKQGARWKFSVRDNGIGMDTRYHDHVFTIFRRLHSEEEYPGIGLGLALARKIVEHRHGGRIWIESEKGKGATVFFTLPTEASNAA